MTDPEPKNVGVAPSNEIQPESPSQQDLQAIWKELSERDRALLRFLWDQPDATAHDSRCARLQKEWGFQAWNTAIHRLEGHRLINRARIWLDENKSTEGWALTPIARHLLAWRTDRDQRSAPFEDVEDVTGQDSGPPVAAPMAGKADQSSKLGGHARARYEPPMKGEKRFGEWIRTSKRVGGGGQGDAFLAFHRDDSSRNKPYVIKQLRNPGRIARFAKEVKAALLLDHPGIVKVVASDLKADKPYLVTPYYANGELTFSFVSKLSPPDKLRLFAKVCRAVGFAHGQGIVHRDLKPQNVLVAEDGSPVVADFGICYIRDEDRATKTLEAVGSRFCTPQELEDGRAEVVTATSDVYCLGKLLYWMFAGRSFHREKHREGDFDLTKKPPIATHALLYELLDQMIVADASKRLRDGNAVAELAEVQAYRMATGGHVIALDAPQECNYCRLGNYEIRVDPRLWRTSQYSGDQKYHVISTALQLYGMRTDLNQPWLVLQCNRCGNLQTFQLFGTDALKQAWK